MKFFAKAVLLFIISSLVTHAMAQSTVLAGIRSGINYASFRGGDAAGYNTLKGFQAGGFIGIGTGGNGQNAFSAINKLEIVYSRQGAVMGKEKIDLTYINFPLMIQRYFYQSGIFIETGLQAGLLLNAKKEMDNRSSAIKDNFKAASFGFNFGTGYKHESGIGINLRYSVDLAPIYRDGSDIHNATLSAGLFFLFSGRGNGYY